MDIVDIAEESIERETAQMLLLISSRCPIPLNHSGHCLECGESVSEGRRWCSADCRDYYQSRR